MKTITIDGKQTNLTIDDLVTLDEGLVLHEAHILSVAPQRVLLRKSENPALSGTLTTAKKIV